MEIIPKQQVEVTQVAKPSIFPFSYKIKCIILCCICFLFYGNSILNKYAFDDNIAILDNSYVQMGISGIPKILTNDSWASFYTNSGGDKTTQLVGQKRFRPLSEIVFALEQQLFGGSEILPYFRHLVNILFYMACVMAIFYFLEKFLLKKTPYGSDIAFLSAFLFAIHPLHTEVVANIKSLDEILSILFVMLTFIYGLKYLQRKQIKHLVLGTGSFLLALFSKEYALALIFFIPFIFYLLEDKKPISAIKAAIPYYIVFVVYLLIRNNAVGLYSHVKIHDTNLLTNPYLYATPIQKFATEWFVLGKYLGLLIFPYPLSADYSYYQIKYHDFSDITVLLSVLIYTAVLVWGIILALKKDVRSFAVFFYLFNIFLISNFVLDIGGTMGERSVFHSSLGFVIILSYYLLNVISKMPLKTKKNIVVGVMSVIGAVCFGETVVRNAQWKDEDTLFIHDVGVSPDSFMTNSNAAGGYLRLSERKENTAVESKAYLDSVRKYSLRALHFFPGLDQAYNKLGAVYLHLGILDSAEYYWDKIPNYPSVKANYKLLSQFYLLLGLNLGKNGKPQGAIVCIKKALVHDSTNADIWYSLGGAYFSIQKYDSAYYAWNKTLQFNPNYIDAKKGLTALTLIKNKQN